MPPRIRSIWSRRLLAAVLAGAALLLAAEVTLRQVWGLGRPVLYVHDPDIEYYQRPNQDLRRFGNRILVNEYGMRSPSFPERKTDPAELRILVIGDSVVNGGVQTDHEQLATTILARSLQAATGRRVVVGNASAGSWGPPNELAYLRRFGFLDADLLVLVLSSHDAGDMPSGKSPNPKQFPTSNPLTAIGELFQRYVAGRVLPGDSVGSSADPDGLDNNTAVARCLDAVGQIVMLAQAEGVATGVIQHWELDEVESGSPRRGHGLVADLLDRLGVPRIDLASRLPANRTACFRDSIHLTDAGQRALAEAMLEVVRTAGVGRAPPAQ